MTDYHTRMTAQLRELFPDLHYGQITHIANCIGNELRKRHNDIYLVELAAEPFPNDSGYYSEFMVVACGQTTYVRITVD
ncbi:hypothetical protein Y940_004817 [Salmonella enterica subsp. enterica]|uniref:Uncharacterized protein n=2 Tax=Salmonella enterica I TaxID=59201 RepID=A0A2T8WP27_SALET|nr:hypothetical protein [Salmonella enterica]EDU6025961.1 hypothetical protein [Salmonella enterica subsp. enterica serovar Brazil]EAA8649194.1 hypothetical protein [Salmonella enterica]EAM2836137.1 hypothetical protein [Salmonella enterica]EAM8460845.1 hypothetical protein [Salmonella enterica]EAO5454885.1 hypothetical protein [Salmonella enterica]